MTTSTTRRSRLAAVAAFTAAGALLLSACGDQTDDAGGDGGESAEETSGESSPAAENELFAMLPADVQEAGEIVVGSDIAYAPIEFIDENDEIAGVDPDIAAAMGEALGVEFTFENGTFDNLILGLNNGRYDVVMSAMTDTAERQEGTGENGGVDFVNYFQAGSAVLVEAGNPEGIETLADLCGLTAAAQQGTANESLLEEQQGECDEEIDVMVNDTDDASITALQTGRAQAVITDFPVALYNEAEAGDGELFEVVGEQIDAAPYGIAVDKENTGLRDALQAAVQEIMDNGTYAEVLGKWDAENGAIDEATVNAGT